MWSVIHNHNSFSQLTTKNGAESVFLGMYLYGSDIIQFSFSFEVDIFTFIVFE